MTTARFTDPPGSRPPLRADIGNAPEECSIDARLIERHSAADDFVNFYSGRLLRHSREEEELFYAPLVHVPDARDLVMQARGPTSVTV